MITNQISVRTPAEWEPQKAIWLTWPHNSNEWGSRIENIRKFYLKLIAQSLQYQNVNLLINRKEIEPVKFYIDSIETIFNLEFFNFPHNDVWIRDYGPFFIEENYGRQTKSKILNFEFNCYGGKFPPWNLDNEIPQKIANHFHLPIKTYPYVLEGGSVEFNGKDILITTEQCLLNKNRNPELSRLDIETMLKEAFGVKHIIWIKDGLIGDHTDGHIDDFVRFVGENEIVISQTDDQTNPNYNVLKEASDVLMNWLHPETGSPLKIHQLPMPTPIAFNEDILPASYANFIFLNNAIILPTFSCQQDITAIQMMQKIFPKRNVIGLDCTLLIQEGGGLHCISKHEPLFSKKTKRY